MKKHPVILFMIMGCFVEDFYRWDVKGLLLKSLSLGIFGLPGGVNLCLLPLLLFIPVDSTIVITPPHPPRHHHPNLPNSINYSSPD